MPTKNNLCDCNQGRLACSCKADPVGKVIAEDQAACKVPIPAELKAVHVSSEVTESDLCRADWLADWSEDRPAYADYLKGWLACAKSRASR